MPRMFLRPEQYEIFKLSNGALEERIAESVRLMQLSDDDRQLPLILSPVAPVLA